MKPQRCLVSLADHNAGIELGDCWRACVATILRLPAREVPNFVDLAKDEFLERTRDWLADRGWALFLDRFTSADWPFDKLVAWLGKSGPGVAFIVTGEGGGEAHAVVAIDGKVHDPSDCGIQGPSRCNIEGCDCEPYWWVYVLSPAANRAERKAA